MIEERRLRMGHLRKRGNSYLICIYTPTGRYHESVRGSRAEAKARMLELEATHSKGVPLPKGRLTLGEHLADWLNGYVRSNCSQRTVDGYESIIRQHLAPALGSVQLKELQPQQIQSYYGKAVGKLSPRTVTKHHRLLSQALKYAVRQGLLGRNVCDLVSPPRWKGKTMRTLAPAELEALLEGAAESQFYPVIYTGVSTGLRQAELLGLRWRDADLDLLSISVSQTLYKRRGAVEFKETKTAHSRRRVAMTPKLALYLRAYRLECQLSGKPVGLDSLVFCYQDGRPLDPSILSHEFHDIMKKVGLEGVRFHDLRHTFASLALLRGAKPKVISEALGHSSVAFTMDTYSHIISGMQEDMMTLLDDVIPSGVNGKAKEAIS
jgi:integrase